MDTGTSLFSADRDSTEYHGTPGQESLLLSSETHQRANMYKLTSDTHSLSVPTIKGAPQGTGPVYFLARRPMRPSVLERRFVLRTLALAQVPSTHMAHKPL